MEWRLDWFAELPFSPIWKPPLLKGVRPNPYDIIPWSKEWLCIWAREECLCFVLSYMELGMFQAVTLFNEWYSHEWRNYWFPCELPDQAALSNPCASLKSQDTFNFFNSLPKSIFKVVIAAAARYEDASASLHLSKGISEKDHSQID